MKCGAFCWLFVLSCFTVAVPAQELPAFPPARNVRVLCIGVNGYEQDCVAKQPGGGEIKVFANLKHAEADAEAMRDILAGKFGYDVHLLTHTKATKARILEELEWLEGAGKDGAAIFYFSGHGTTAADKQQTPSGRGAFMVPAGSKLGAEVPKGLAADAPANQVATGAKVPNRLDALTTDALQRRTLSVDEVRRRLKEAKVHHSVVIVDACCAGFELDGADTPLFRAKGAGGDDTRYTVFEKSSECILTAGTDAQQTFEGKNSPADLENAYLAKAPGHGWYTAELIHRLNKIPLGGAATTLELYADLQSAVQQRSGGINAANSVFPQYRGRGDGMFVWVCAPTEHWLRRVAADAAAHDKVVRGEQRGDPNRDKGPARTPAGVAPIRKKGPAGAPERGDNAPPQTQTLEQAASELDLLVVAVKAGELRAVRQADPAQFDKDPRWQDWKQRCVLNASAGDPKAMTALYYAYDAGICVPKNPRMARSWLQEGMDGNDATAASVFNFSFQQKARPPAPEEDKEAAQATAALSGALLAVQGARQGDAGATAVGVGVMAVALAKTMDEPGIKDAIGRIISARTMLNAELTNIHEPNKERVSAALVSVGAEAQKIEALTKSDRVQSPFKRLGGDVASRLKQEIQTLKTTGVGAAGLAEFNRRCDELLALYTARCAVIQSDEVKNGAKPPR